MKKDFVSVLDFTREETERLFELTSALKPTPSKNQPSLHGKTVVLIFEKPSL